MIAAVMATLQTLFNFAEREERHKKYGAKYATLKRKLELAFTSNSMGEEEFSKFAKELLKQMETLGEESPHIPSKVWFKTEKRYKSR